MMTAKLNDKDTKHEMMKAFRLFVQGETSGQISLDTLRRVARELGEELRDEELQEMLDEADKDGSFLDLKILYVPGAYASQYH
jgi:Ca2+-binding EF-hand superfamily protein